MNHYRNYVYFRLLDLDLEGARGAEAAVTTRFGLPRTVGGRAGVMDNEGSSSGIKDA